VASRYFGPFSLCGVCPWSAARVRFTGCAVNFAPYTANLCPFYEKYPVWTPGYAAESPGCGEKLLELRLRRNGPGAPRPQPVLAGILRLCKRAFLPLDGLVRAA
jgi:hypothetical protein